MIIANKTSTRLVRLFALFALLLTPALLAYPQAYKKPPKEVLDVLNAPVTPAVSISPGRDMMLLATGVRYPPLSDLAQPMLRLAGLRINPNTNGPHRRPYYVALALKRISDGKDTQVALPSGAHIDFPEWSPDSKHFAFANTTPTGIELWIGDSATGQIKQRTGARINAIYGEPYQWLPDNRTIIAQLVPADRQRLISAPSVPREPVIQESTGKAGPLPTFEDLLKTPYDEEQFEYYASAQLALVDTATGKATNVGQPGIFETVDPAPNGQLLLTARLHRPFSYLFPADAFPKEVEVWDMKGQSVYKLASLPLADQVPIDGVPEGPREYSWRPTAAATLVWAEALDKGNPKLKVAHRDRLLMLAAPFKNQPDELMQTEQRFTELEWTERADNVFISDYDRDTRKARTVLVHADNRTEPPRTIWYRSVQDRYSNPGAPIVRELSNGHRAITQNGAGIYLSGLGASPEGDRPFLDAMNLQSLQTVRLFRSDKKSYELPIALLNDNATQFVTRRESPTEPPNFFIRTTSAEVQDVKSPSSGMKEALYSSASKAL